MARRIVRDFKPDIAIGVGGYASGPTLKAAQKAGVPTLVQEQNSYPGVTNRILARKAGAVCTAYDNLERFFPAEKIVKTGNPVRKQLSDIGLSRAEAKEKLGFDADKLLLLVVGGSLGARTINNTMAASLDRITAAGNVQILWQTGRSGEEIGRKASEGRSHVKATPFISDMATAYRAADLVVSRAGAGTISELELLGKAAVLVPSPNVSEDHQRHNAEALSSKDAAVMILDADALERLPLAVTELLGNEKRRKALEDNILRMGIPDSDELIVDEAVKLMDKK